MEAQRAAVEAYARQTGATLSWLYTEVESGKLADRPELAKALAHARRSKATLVVAKLDRLARNVEFLARVMNAGTEFVACDNPAANRLTLHILAAVAEAEAKAISDRTKAALAAYKARGGKLGGQLPQCRNLTAEARRRAPQRRQPGQGRGRSLRGPGPDDGGMAGRGNFLASDCRRAERRGAHNPPRPAVEPGSSRPRAGPGRIESSSFLWPVPVSRVLHPGCRPGRTRPLAKVSTAVE